MYNIVYGKLYEQMKKSRKDLFLVGVNTEMKKMHGFSDDWENLLKQAGSMRGQTVQYREKLNPVLISGKGR